MLTVTPPEPVQETATPQTRRPTPKERKAAGKALRAGAPLDAHAAVPFRRRGTR